MTFQGIGQATVTATLGSRSAVAAVEVDLNAMPRAEAAVGPAGGTVRLVAGTGVDVPVGALSSTHTIAVERVPLPPATPIPPNSVVSSALYEFTPAGPSFDVPASVSIRCDGSLIGPGFDVDSTLMYILQPDGTFAVDTIQSTMANERLALGRDLVGAANEPDANVTFFRRGISTVGGLGSAATDASVNDGRGGTGGQAGTIAITNSGSSVTGGTAPGMRGAIVPRQPELLERVIAR